MKYLRSLILAALLILSLAACGRRTDAPASEDQSIAAETVLLDEGGIVVTATGFDADGEDGPTLLLQLKNGMDRDVQIFAQDSSINGYMIDAMPYWTDADGSIYYGEAPRVAAGGTMDSKLIFNTYDMRRSGVETIAEIELSFRVDDADTWETLLESAPAVLRTAAAEGFTQAYDESGTSVYESGGVRIIIQGIEEDVDWGGAPSVTIYVANESGRTLYVTTASAAVNGTDMTDDTYFGAVVPDGKRQAASLSFGALDDAALDELTLAFRIIDASDMETIVAETAPATLRWTG